MARGGFDEGNQSRRLLSELLMLISEQKQIQSHSRLLSSTRGAGAAEEVTPLQLEGWSLSCALPTEPLAYAYISNHGQVVIVTKATVRWL